MTLVRTLQTLPNPDGTRRPAEGFFIWTPTERRIIEGNPDEVVQPAGFAVELNAGAFEVDVAATGISWVWRVDERLKGLRAKTSYVVVPPEGPVDFTDLIPVNIASLKDTSVPDHIWYIYTDHLAEQARLAKEAAQASEDAAVESQDSALTSKNAAAESATSAYNYAQAAGGHASYAGSSAFSAGTSAATALGHKNDAEEAEAGAVAAESNAVLYRDQANIARTAAETARLGSEAAKSDSETARDGAELALSIVEGIELNQVETGLVDASGHLILTKRDESTVDAGKVILPTTLTVGTVDTGPDLIGNIGPMGPQGPKGDPGGWTTPQVISSGTSLNLILTPGLYLNPQSNVANGPSNSTNGGHLEVIAAAGYIYQRYTPIAEVRETYVRSRNSAGTWGSWYVHNVTRVDQTAGRVIYQWDDVNNREQIIYGDTGWRAVALDPTIGVAACGNFFARPSGGGALSADAIMIRRVNNVVYIGGQGALQPQQDYSTATRNIIQLPIGWRATGTGEHLICKYGNNGGDTGQRLVYLMPGATYASPAYLQVTPLLDTNWAGRPTGEAYPKLYHGIWLCGTYTTPDPWPTSLPGVASGPIPNL